MESRYLLLGICGLILRISLLRKSYSDWLSRRIEISTPVSSWRRVVEGISLQDHGYSAFQGDMYHQSPLLLAFFRGIWSSPLAVDIVFVMLDVLTAFAFYHIAEHFQSAKLARQKKEEESYSSGIEEILYRPIANIGIATAVIYWLNPFVIVTCAARSTTVLVNFMVAWSILAAMRGRTMAACLGLSLAIHHDPYMVVMFVPLAMILTQKQSSASASLNHTMLLSASLVALMTGGLLGLCYIQTGSWDFLSATYGFVFSVPDFTPNVGLFWYLFTEMFDHFRMFFLWVFQLHVFFYVLPMGMRLREHPYFLLYVMSHVVGVFKSYPALGDTVLPLTLIFLWRHLFIYIRGILVIAVMFLASIVLMPTFWYLWIVAGSGNANFFYSGTLAYNLAHVLLMTGCVTAFLRREFDLRHGKTPSIKGKPAAVVLE